MGLPELFFFGPPLAMYRVPFQRRWLLLPLLAFGLALAGRTSAAVPIEVKVVVFSVGEGPDAVSFVYSTPAKGSKARHEIEAHARQDYERLAAAVGQPAAAARITTVSNPIQAPPTTSAEGKLPHLVNRPAGWLNIGPFLKVFRRYDRLSLTYFVQPPFQFRGPRGPFDDPTLAMTLDVEGSAYTYDVRIKHAAGEGSRALPLFEAPAGGLASRGKLAYLLVALMALAAGVAVYALLLYWLQRRNEGVH
jgi:hypothetical protein